MKKTKKFVIINTIVTFLLGFIVHGMYTWFPSFITSIFPVNESLYEHVKLVYLSPILSVLIVGIFYHYKINNIFYGMLISIIFNILFFYMLYLPIYYLLGNSMIMTLIVYFISIVASNYIYYLIIERRYLRNYNLISLIISILGIIFLTYFSYYPPRVDFFKDPINDTYGIKK